MANDRDIAVVGMSAIFPKAPDMATYWSNLVNGVDGITELPEHRIREAANFRRTPDHEAYIPCSRGGYLPKEVWFDPMAYGVVPNLVKHGDPDQFFMLQLIDLALRDAGVENDDPARERTDVIIGRGGYPTGKLVELTLRSELYDTFLELIDRGFPEIFKQHNRLAVEKYLRSTLTPPAVDNVSTAVSNITASRTANRLNLHGAAFIVDAACASSLVAVEQAVGRLRSGQSDLAVAAGVFLNMTPTFFYVFASLGALSPTATIRPFDRRADGLLVGEGGGALILKRRADAERDGDRVYAIIKGVGSSSDGKNVDVLAPSSDGQLKALQRAYRDADVDPDTISFLEAHGTGTVVGDQVELHTIKRFFGTVNEPATARAMGSVKSMVGHTMPAAGMASMVKMILSLSNKVMPPSLHCDEPRPEMADAPFYVNSQTRPWVYDPRNGLRRGAVNSFGFGGINVHVVLEEMPESSTVPTRLRPRPISIPMSRASELLAFSADSQSELEGKIERVEKYLEADLTEPTLAEVSKATVREADFTKPFKLALVCNDFEHMRQVIAEYRQRMASGENFRGLEEVYYTSGTTERLGKIAYVFPGMGFPGLIGNYPDHLLQLAIHYPQLRREFDYFEHRDGHPEDIVPTSSIFSPPPNVPEETRMRLKAQLAPPTAEDMKTVPHPSDRYLAATGISLANWLGWTLTRSFDMPVDMMTGQSQGEMAAVCAAGVTDFHASTSAFWKVMNVEACDPEGGRLAFTWISAEKVQPLIDENPGTHIAIYMAPESIILGGNREGLLRIRDKLQAEQILFRLLPYAPIHTPGLSHLREEVMRYLDTDKLDVQPPKIDIYSSITTQKYPSDPDGIMETLMLNIDHPLRIWQTIRQMYDDGARIFVQVGGGHMAAHLEKMLPEGAKTITAALDVDTRDPITQLCHALGSLFTSAVPFTWDGLFSHRPVRDIDLDHPTSPPERTRMTMPLRIDWTPLYSEKVPPKVHSPVETTNGSPDTSIASEIPSEPTAEVLEPAPTATSFAQPQAAVASVADSQAAENAPALDPSLYAHLPVLGNVVRLVPEQEIVIDRVLDIDKDLFLRDHVFVHAPSKPYEERLPVLPLTVSMEFLSEAAALLSPGLGLIGFEQIRGLRWIGLRDKKQVDLRIEVRLLSVDENGVRRLQGTFYFEDKPGFSGIALFAPAYRQDVQFQMVDSSGDGPWWLTLDQVYGDRHMFHGPAFFCLADLYTMGNPGASAALQVRPKDQLFTTHPDPWLLTDPCLMDGIGQVVGLWALGHNQYILPTTTEKIEFYCPTPPVGTVTPIRIEVVELNQDTKQIRCNIEIENGQGQVWVRVSGWIEWIMKWSTKYADTTRLPNRYMLADTLDVPDLPPGSVVTLTTKQDFRDIDTDWGARIFLHGHEMTEYWARDSIKRRRELLYSRVTVKDAIRLWWSQQHGTELPHPADLCIGHDEAGAPYLEPAGDPAWPHISLAHLSDVVVAIASDVPVGIDLLKIGSTAHDILPTFATPTEIALIDSLASAGGAEHWFERLWCAKEAVAKALRTGLDGRPKNFEAIDGDATGRLLMQHHPSGERLVVSTFQLESLIVAYTARGEAGYAEGSLLQKWQMSGAGGSAATE